MTRQSRPHLLWVTPSAPDHEGGGDQIRQAFLLDSVARLGDVTLVSPQRPTDPRCLEALRRVVKVPAVDAPGWSRPRAVRWLLGSRHPWYVHQARRQRALVQECLLPLLDDADLVLVEHLELAPLLTSRRGEPWLLTLHLSHRRQSRQRANVERSWARRAFWLIDAARARCLERWAARYDTLVAVSTEDARGLKGRVEVVPNGVDVHSFDAGPLPREPRLLFTGSLDYAPNVDGLEWFLREAWPRIRSAVPSAQLTVAGRRPGPQLARMVNDADGTTLAADPDAIAPFFARARIVIVPIRHGAGTRLKALQGLAAGRVVVGTTIGLEGLGLVDRRTALVADDVGVLASACVTACVDDDLAESVAAAGREFAANFDWSLSGAQLNELLGQLTAGQRGPMPQES